ncbi:hypothetical protein [Sphingomonas xinjiangensis]|uniref:PIN domain nuclease of toxin-antitoxin system n=1 Tax=Sphingomonas xinjiangensis TaxID=643568 RepID=A0A840YF89_9SPHN|nr:hypothetical protein [Sphingomonas xinjiangensis]MBB5712117.1 PIN domain nuclease of toxin-antitoxin system [Sphingomonas xinjiangensis]
MSRVFDASAVVALLNSEKGAAKAASLVSGSSLSAVYAIEVQQKLIDAGMEATDTEEMLQSLGLAIVAFDALQASVAASLRHLRASIGCLWQAVPVSLFHACLDCRRCTR